VINHPFLKKRTKKKLVSHQFATKPPSPLFFPQKPPFLPLKNRAFRPTKIKKRDNRGKIIKKTLKYTILRIKLNKSKFRLRKTIKSISKKG